MTWSCFRWARLQHCQMLTPCSALLEREIKPLSVLHIDGVDPNRKYKEGGRDMTSASNKSLSAIDLGYMARILTSGQSGCPLAPLSSHQVITIIHRDQEIRLKQTHAKPPGVQY